MSALRRLGAATVWLTLAAGAVGAVRQRREAEQVRAGTRVAAGPAGEVPPARPAAPLAERVANWTPARPRTAAGRLLAAVWAAPLSVAGLGLCLAGRGRPRWSSEHGALVCTGVGGISGALLARVGAEANAVGQVIVCRAEDPPAVLLAHETGHVRQAERLGPLLALLYPWWSARYGYRDHPVERGARAAARAWADRPR
ncbi:MAG: hypothetical protein ACLGIR_06955 [Actinomycetes bacterium]